MATAEFEPVEIFDQLLAARSPRSRLDYDFLTIAFDVLSEQRIGMLTGLV
ncbi:hypothetical protein [Bradyrhizobium sp. CCBAU 11386]|nr:hypothetical protein [Bradyrhizobium sp. CCBAU 11386]